ncbi:MAG: hypothetical protein LBB09_01030, partial [Rickettsiales bacterium]|nr:hypothetical protein [Rickettsiales bacterium]
MEKNTEEIKNKIIKNYEAFDKKRVLLDDKIKRKINLERIYAPSKETVVTLADDSEIKFEKFNPGKERGILGMKKKNMNKFEYGGKKFLVLDNDIENFYTVRLLNFLGCETMRASLFKDEKIGKTFIAYEKVDSMGQFGANDRETQKIIHDNKLGDAIVQRNIITSVMGDEDNHYQNMLVTEKDGEKRIAHIDVSLSGKN